MAPRYKDGDAVVAVSATARPGIGSGNLADLLAGERKMDFLGSYCRRVHGLLQCSDRRNGSAFPEDCAERTLRLS